jgi:hypothetical protein
VIWWIIASIVLLIIAIEAALALLPAAKVFDFSGEAESVDEGP